MRTPEEIRQEIETEADKHPELSELQRNTSQASWWVSLKSVFAALSLTMETVFELYRKDLDKALRKTEAGTKIWLKNKVMEYQHRDTLVLANNVPQYFKPEPSKRIIKRATLKNLPSGGVKIKVAKETGGKLVKLDVVEKQGLETYLSQIGFIGIPLQVVSEDPNELKITKATIEISKDVFDTSDPANP